MGLMYMCVDLTKLKKKKSMLCLDYLRKKQK